MTGKSESASQLPTIRPESSDPCPPMKGVQVATYTGCLFIRAEWLTCFESDRALSDVPNDPSGVGILHFSVLNSHCAVY